MDHRAHLISCAHGKTDEEILEFFALESLHAVAVDAPQGLPLEMGLCCLEENPRCNCPLTGARQCEILMRRQGIPLYPVTKNSFAKAWIRRGLLLFLRFQGMRIPAFEVYPTGSKRILFPGIHFPKPKSSRAARTILQEQLSRQIDGMPPPQETLFSDHLLDAILGAYTIYLHYEKHKCTLIGDPREGQILLPHPETKKSGR